MNPLDRQELQPFLRNLKEEMPIHTHNTAKIKRSYSQGMPKNLMDYSAFVNNHFLNDNLAIIEEMQHRNKQHPIPKWFRDYQIRHYAKYGILKGDHFFGPFAKIFPDLGEHRGIGFLPYAGMTLGFGTIGDTKVLGADITIGGTGATDNTGSNNIRCFKFTTGVADKYYDRIAQNINSAAGNERLGCYSDNAGVPNNLYSESADIACANGFNWRTVTEFALGGANGWIACQLTSNACVFHYQATGNYHLKSWTYGAFENPLTAGSGGASYCQNMKIGHS